MASLVLVPQGEHVEVRVEILLGFHLQGLRFPGHHIWVKVVQYGISISDPLGILSRLQNGDQKP